MINVKIDASLVSSGVTKDDEKYFHPIWTKQSIDNSDGYEPSFSVANQSQIDAFLNGTSAAAQAFENDPSQITSTRVVWGTDTTGVIVNGASLSGISDIDQLQTALEGGTGDGQFNTITVVESGQEVLELTLDEQGLSVASGDQSFEIAGALPQTFQGIFDFVEHLGSLETLDTMTGAEQNDLETFMADYSITEFALKDGAETMFSLSLGTDKVELMIEGASIALAGTFPLGNLGNLVDTLYELETSENSVQTLNEINALSDVELTALTLKNDLGIEIMSVSMAQGTSSFEVIGTDNWDRDVLIEPFEDDEGNFVPGVYRLGKGEDTAILDVDDVVWGDRPFQDVATVDGGDDFDRLIISGYDLWDSSQWDGNDVPYIGPDSVSINFDSGAVSLERGEDTLSSMSVSNFEALSINLPSFDFVGSSGNDKLFIDEEADYFSFDGGSGRDQLVLKYTNFMDSDYNWVEGVTYKHFADNFTYNIADDGTIQIFDVGSETLAAELNNVEEIRFSDGQGGEEILSTNEIFGISDSLGTADDDALDGNSDANEISGLAGDDDIYGNGGADTLLGGDGNDSLYTKGSGATVDGGAGWNRLGIEDYPEETDAEIQRSLVISTNGNFGTVEFLEADVASGQTTFTNIDAFVVDTDRDVVLNGSDQDDRLHIRDAQTVDFNGGAGTDRLDLRGVETYDDDNNRVDFTRQIFEDWAFIEQTDSGETIIRDEGTGEIIIRLKDVEEIRFANGTDEGEVVNVSDLVESSEGGTTVQIEEDNTEEVALTGGDDTVTGSTGNDTIDGGAGDDVVDLGAGDDVVDSGEGNDSVNGGDGNDQIFDATGDDTINGGAGADQGVSLSGNNTFEDEEAETPPEETNTIDDFYCGGYGNDIFKSGDGNDIIIGDVGSVYYFGDDVLLGGRGNDILQAGYGADTFEFRSGDGNDVIGRVDLDALMSSWPDDIADVQMLEMADFEIGIDTIKLLNFGSVNNATSLQAALGNGTMSISNDSDGNAVFESRNGSITLIGIDASDLTVDHFEF